jgi:hypothetical protein
VIVEGVENPAHFTSWRNGAATFIRFPWRWALDEAELARFVAAANRDAA